MNFRLYFLGITLGLASNTHILAQTNSISRDTSFSVAATFEKERKNFPNIAIAKVNSSDLLVQQNIIYKTIGERKLTVDIFRSSNKNKNTAILLVHGGGWRAGDKTHMHQLAQALAHKGYTCLAVEYRLSGEAIYPAAVEDLQDAIDWINQKAEHYGINSQQIVCVGTSSGGQLTALLGSINGSKKDKTKLLAVVNIDGLISFIHPDAQEGTMAAQWLGGDSTRANKQWKEASAITHLNPKSAPMLFITSSYKRFSAGKNELMFQYEKWNIPYQELHFEQSPHTFWYFHPWFIPTVEKIDIFLNIVLKQ